MHILFLSCELFQSSFEGIISNGAGDIREAGRALFIPPTVKTRVHGKTVGRRRKNNSSTKFLRHYVYKLRISHPSACKTVLIPSLHFFIGRGGVGGTEKERTICRQLDSCGGRI